MFVVGKEYIFRILGEGDDGFKGTVEAYEHPLIKLAPPPSATLTIGGLDLGQPGDETVTLTSVPRRGKIINVTSSAFVSAEEVYD